MTIRTVNPATGQAVNEYQPLSEREVDTKIAAAARAFAAWKASQTLEERAAPMRAAARILEEEKESYAALMAMEMGKPIKGGRAEVEKCAWVCRHYADHAAEMLTPVSVSTDAQKSYITFTPLGIVLGVMPWNYPFWQVFRYAVPAMMAGNAVLLKHASIVPGCGQAIEAVMQKAGFPEALFQNLLIPSDPVGHVIAHPQVRAVTLTGSAAAGREVAAQAAQSIKPTVLELGGSDPYLVLEDADLAPTVKACVAGRLLNSGQSCIAAKRFIVVDAVREAFEQRCVEEMRSVRMGDPQNEDTEVGPLAGATFRETLHRQVRKSIENGARCLLGGKIPEGSGFFYPLTVLSDVRPGMPAFDEETFGPVAAIVPAADEAQAIQLANQTAFGLGAAVFTRDTARGERIAAEQLEAGSCFVNAFVKSDPRLPFGGIKASGYGRELSQYGLKSFVNVKTIYVA
ncbi:MAG: NAD-dependent succinate-semialdehyde dehydrogenase [Desulfosarcinaceae bacterium]|jgi:succinate-semialdehyde dehydrogenase/glutarate-semialdehyde dehydrogenase